MIPFACSTLKRTLVVLPISLLACSSMLFAQNPTDTIKDHRTTEIYSPVPPIVTPADKPGAPPSDAIILFDGKNQDQWALASNGQPADWIVDHDILTVNKKPGNIQKKQAFANYQPPHEVRIPANISGSDQARGNSGVF